MGNSTRFAVETDQMKNPNIFFVKVKNVICP